MKAYDLNTRFTFGKYEGKTLEEVFKQDPAYIEKSLVTVDDFAIDEKSIQKLFETYPDNELSDDAVDANLDKLDAMDADDDIMFNEEIFDGFENEDELEDDGGKGVDDEENDNFFEDDGFDDNWSDDAVDDDEDDFR